MEIEFKKYYNTLLNIIVEPSNRDIECNFFQDKKMYHLKLPCQFDRGQKFTLDFNCISCENNFLINNIYLPFEGMYESNYINLKNQSTNRYKKNFIEKINTIFHGLIGKDCGHFYAFFLKRGGVANIFYIKCPHCGAQYFATYYDIEGKCIEDRVEPTPDQFYIEEIVWVEFDEKEFFKEMKLCEK
jgi:hypothetical protein